MNPAAQTKLLHIPNDPAGVYSPGEQGTHGVLGSLSLSEVPAAQVIHWRSFDDDGATDWYEPGWQEGLSGKHPG
jgi:hypothetical protein